MRKTVLTIILLSCTSILSGQTTVRIYNQKLSAATVDIIERGFSTRSAEGLGRANVYLHLAPEADITRISEEYGIKFNVRCGNVCTALVPYSELERLAEDDEVKSIDVGHEVHQMMDEARKYAHVDEAHNGETLSAAYKGSGVLVGIIDAGFDFLHPNFRDAYGNCRILAAWDQNNFFTTDSPYGYGKEYKSTAEVIAAGRDMELTGDTHGTHVAGIAAGSHDNAYTGVAPEADIVIVSTNKTEQGIIDGIDYLLKYSDKADMPISINLSIGTVLGFKDGTDDFTMMTDELMAGRTGQLLSVAAGNEGDRRSTLTGTFDGMQTTIASYWIPPTYNRDNLLVQGEAGANYSLTLSLIDNTNNRILFSCTFDSTEKQTQSFENFGTLSGDGTSRMNVSVSENPCNGNPYFRINMTYDKPENEIWEITLSSNNGRYMINSDYGEFSSEGSASHIEGTNNYTIATTATGRNSIAVGAYVTKNTYEDIDGTSHERDWCKGDAYILSGKGPTYDNRIKPDVSAPGAMIVSSFSSYAGSYYVSTTDKVEQMTDNNGRTYSWGVASGTSMATPIVTGTLALWLEANPQLTSSDICTIIQATSTRDEFTGYEPNGIFGYGKLNTLAGLEYIEQLSSIRHDTANGITYRLYGNTIIISGDIKIDNVSVYGFDGQLIKKTAPVGNRIVITVAAHGVYIVKVAAEDGSSIFKIAM